MKEKLTKNIGLKILSIILAALLWLVITNVDDPISEDTFRNVKVDVINSNAITSLGQVYNIVEGETIDIRFAARRSIRDDLTVSDFKVTADLSKLSDLDTVTIKIACPRYGDQVRILNDNHVMKVEREELAKKQFMVNVVQKGNPQKGYYVYEKNTSTLITAVGPKSKVESISQVVVEVDLSGYAGPSFGISETPKALDADGKEIDDANLQFSDRSIYANIGIYKTKKISLRILTTGQPADGFIMTDIPQYEPKKIEIAAEDSILNKIDELIVEEDITGASNNIEKEVELQEQLPEGVLLVGDSKAAVVNIKIEKLDTKVISIMPEDIDVRNKPENLSLAFLTLNPITLHISGLAADMKDLSEQNIKPYIDLSNYIAGLYNVDIHVDLKGHSNLTDSPAVDIKLY